MVCTKKFGMKLRGLILLLLQHESGMYCDDSVLIIVRLVKGFLLLSEKQPGTYRK